MRNKNYPLSYFINLENDALKKVETSTSMIVERTEKKGIRFSGPLLNDDDFNARLK